MRKLVWLCLLAIPVVAHGDPTTIVRDQSGSVVTRARVLKFPNGSITNSAGTVTVTFSTNTASGVYGTNLVNSVTTTITSTMTVVLASAPAGGQTLKLPASSGNAGLVIMISKIDTTTNTVTINANGSDVISGSGTLVLNAFTQTDSIMADGTSNWIPWGHGVEITPTHMAALTDESNTGTVGVSSTIYTCPFNVPIPVAVTGFRYSGVTIPNNSTVAFGIYDQSGNVVVGTGPVTAAAPALTSVLLNGAYKNLPPGQYYLAFQGSNNAIALAGMPGMAGIFCQTTAESAMGMASSVTIGGGSNTGRGFLIDILVSGGRKNE